MGEDGFPLQFGDELAGLAGIEDLMHGGTGGSLRTGSGRSKILEMGEKRKDGVRLKGYLIS